MKFIVYSLFILSSIFIDAKYSIKGTVENYNNKGLLIYSYLNNSEILLTHIQTNEKGEFQYSNKEEYNGILKIFFAEPKISKVFFVDNNAIEFNATLDKSDFSLNSINDKGNQLFYENEDFNAANSKIDLLQTVKAKYNPKDQFFGQISTEIQRLRTLKEVDFSNYPFINYYVDLEKNFLNKNVETVEESKQMNAKILSKLINDDEKLEKTNLLNNLLNTYVNYSVAEHPTSEAQVASLRPTIDHVLEETIIETNRGQNVLLGFINVLKSYGLDFIAEEYLAKAEALTCEINPDLKHSIDIANKIKKGQTIPNFNFTEKKNGAKSLYDIKSKYKLVIFWGSFCPHCQQEKPLLKAYYDEFKAKGGEIISFGIETNQAEYTNFTKDLNWINDTDYLFWSSPIVKEYGIDGTPTMFFLDKDHKIIEISSKFELLKAKIEETVN